MPSISRVTGVLKRSLSRMPRKPTGGLHCKHGPENTFHLTSPLGSLELVCCPRGVHQLHLVAWQGDDNFTPNQKQPVTIDSQLYEDNGYTYKSALTCVEWLQTYFHNLPGLNSVTKPPICHLNSSHITAPFTERIWRTLAEDVALGSIVSYGQLAVLSGSTPSASRAVGQAMRNNPVMIIVPCHRVILSSGQMGNYSRGTKNSVKAWLLHHEGALD